MEANLLPFLNKARMQTGVMVKTRAPDESQEPKEQDLESMVKEAVNHYKASDFKQLASCIKSIIKYCESEPSESESNDYASQNEKAAKEQE